jgi:biotin operon repressor
MNEILVQLFEQFGSQSEVARQLGVSQATVWTWMLKLGLRQRTTLIPEKKEIA